jgi:hypothetical protein
MFTNKPKLFSIGTSNLPLKFVSVLITNIIKIKRITNIINYIVETKVNH